MPIFSIITVCLNAGDDLLLTINSILNQTFQDFEIIIKDGISIDGSLNKLPDDNRINLQIQGDSGIYDAMNQAIKFVRGNYILFLNAGDTFSDNSVLLFISGMINKYPGHGLYYYDYKTTYLNTRVYSPRKITYFTLYRNMLCHQCCMFDVNKLRLTGSFDLHYKVVADYDFLLKFLLRNKFSSQYIDILGIIYKSGGYAALNQQIAKKEVNKIRNEFFKRRYLLFKLYHMFTLPKLRNRIASLKFYILRITYLHISNFINKKL